MKHCQEVALHGVQRGVDLVMQHEVVRWLRRTLGTCVALQEPVVGALVGHGSVDDEAGTQRNEEGGDIELKATRQTRKTC